MKTVLNLGAMTLVLSLCVSHGLAGSVSSPLLVTNNSGCPWEQLGGSSCAEVDPPLPVTFFLPQTLGNEPATEPTGDFLLNKPFFLPNGNTFYIFRDPGTIKTISDYILFW